MKGMNHMRRCEEVEETEGKEDFKQEVGLFICGVVDFESCKVLK